jgi:hypothetical protein
VPAQQRHCRRAVPTWLLLPRLAAQCPILLLFLLLLLLLLFLLLLAL